MKNNSIVIARGILIFLVVFGHSIITPIMNSSLFYEYLYNLIYQFHMPAYFFISGFLYINTETKYNKKNIFFSKLKKLLFPYFIFFIVNYFVFLFLGNFDFFANFINNKENVFSIYDFLSQLFLNNNMFDRHLWFIYCLFLVFLYKLNFNFKKSKFINLFISLFIYIIFDILNYYFGLPLIIVYFTKYLFYFELGYLLYYKIVNNYSSKYSLISLFIFLIFPFFKIIIQDNTICNYLIISFLGIICAINGIYLLFLISNIFISFKNKYILGSLNKLSRQSYNIYLIHQPFIINGISYITYKIFDNAFISIIFSTFFGLFVIFGVIECFEYFRKRCLNEK